MMPKPGMHLARGRSPITTVHLANEQQLQHPIS